MRDAHWVWTNSTARRGDVWVLEHLTRDRDLFQVAWKGSHGDLALNGCTRRARVGVGSGKRHMEEGGGSSSSSSAKRLG